MDISNNIVTARTRLAGRSEPGVDGLTAEALDPGCPSQQPLAKATTEHMKSRWSETGCVCSKCGMPDFKDVV